MKQFSAWLGAFICYQAIPAMAGMTLTSSDIHAGAPFQWLSFISGATERIYRRS